MTEWNNPIFRKTSRAVEKFDERLWNLLDDMRETLEKVGGYVSRPKSVTVSAFDRNGNPMTIIGTDFLAATFCHEIDHLDGIIFIDKAGKKE